MLDYIVQFQINIFALMILVVLYLMIRVRSKVKSYGKFLLKSIMIATAIAIIAEPITWIFDKKLFFGAYAIEYSSNFILFMMGPILGGLMLSYVDYHIFKNPKRIQDRSYYMHLSFVTLLVLIFNFFNPIYFTVDPVLNKFRSGVFKEVHYLVIAVPYIYMLYLVHKHKEKISKTTYWIFIILFALPVIGMFVVTIESKLHFSWTINVLAILVVYIFLESSSNEEDYLTKLYNRKSSEQYINHLLETGEEFGVIILDLNLFKEINDVYGHQAGDEVLIAFADTLKQVFHKNALVARIGGDEFIVVLKNPDGKYLQRVNEVKYLLKKHHNPQVKTLTFGHGYHVYEEDITMDELYSQADQKMYMDKKKIKDAVMP